MKRFLSIVLFLSLMVSMAVPAFAVTASTSFSAATSGKKYIILQRLSGTLSMVVTCPSASDFIFDASSGVLTCSPSSILRCYSWDGVQSPQIYTKDSNRYDDGTPGFMISMAEYVTGNSAMKSPSGVIVKDPTNSSTTSPGVGPVGPTNDVKSVHLTDKPNVAVVTNTSTAEISIRLHGVHGADRYTTYFFNNNNGVGGTNTSLFTSFSGDEYRNVTVGAGKQLVIINNGGYTDLYYKIQDTTQVISYTLTNEQIMNVLSGNGNFDVSKGTVYDWGPNNTPLSGGSAAPTDLPGFIAWVVTGVTSVFSTVTGFVTGMQSSVGNMATVFGNFLQLPAPIMGMIVTGMGIGILLRILGR